MHTEDTALDPVPGKLLDGGHRHKNRFPTGYESQVRTICDLDSFAQFEPCRWSMQMVLGSFTKAHIHRMRIIDHRPNSFARLEIIRRCNNGNIVDGAQRSIVVQ